MCQKEDEELAEGRDDGFDVCGGGILAGGGVFDKDVDLRGGKVGSVSFTRKMGKQGLDRISLYTEKTSKPSLNRK